MKPIFFDKKTCVTCKKTQAFLNENKVEFEIVDIIKNPPEKEILAKFIDADNVKSYLNTRSTSYRELNLGQNIPNKAKAIKLMLQDPNLIKRPFIVKDDTATFGLNVVELTEKWL